MNGGAPGTRRTFVVQIHADGTATVENLSTRERVPIVMSALGDRIEAWLAVAPAETQPAASREGSGSRPRGKPPERGGPQ